MSDGDQGSMTPRKRKAADGGGDAHEIDDAAVETADGAAQSSEEQRRLRQLRQSAHAGTVGRLAALHGAAADVPGSREAAARGVGQLLLDATVAAAEAGAPPTTKQGKPAVVGEGGDPTQFHAAVVAARQLADEFPDWGEAHYLLGFALLGMAEYDEAAVAYEEAVRLDPTHQEARIALAQKEEYERQCREEDAQIAREDALALVQGALERLPAEGGFRRGQTLLVSGLKGAPQHNGKSGSCLSWNDAKGRYNVELESGEIVGIRPANLAPYTAGGTCWAGGEWRREDDGGRFWADGAWQRWAKDPAPLCDVGGELLGYESDESDGAMEDDTP